jgi:hypothetical protein
MNYDIIGDVHGQDAKLKPLLKELGYRIKDGAYRHPEGRTALFLGDLIDRGPGQIEVINTVRNMMEAGSARAIMGNHEWNAIGFATPDPEGKGYLRGRSVNRRKQHAEFLCQVGEDSVLHKEFVAWFRTLPPFLDLGDVCLIHAWWNQEFVDQVAESQEPDGRLSEEFVVGAFKRGSDSYVAMEGLTKGLEIDLPEGFNFLDHTGIERKVARVQWWNDSAETYRDSAMVPGDQVERIPDLRLPITLPSLSVDDSPVFIGHYWLSGTPSILAPNVACIDYGAGKDGPLVAYRWNGEPELSDEGFVVAGG